MCRFVASVDVGGTSDYRRANRGVICKEKSQEISQ